MEQRLSEPTHGTIYCGDSLEVLRQWPDACVDCVVTDPPYGLSFMGKKWDYDVPSVELWREVFRVLKDGGRCFAFSGSRTYHRMAVNIEDAGFTIEDSVIWLYGSGFPKHKSKLKPAHEPICVARKGKVSELQIDAGRIAYRNDTDAELAKPASPGNPNGLYGYGGAWAGQNPDRGRWPANVCCDEYAAGEIDRQSGTLSSGMMQPGQQRKATLGGGGYHGNMPDEATAEGTYGDSGGASRFYYCAKASPGEREAGLSGFEVRAGGQRSNTSGQHITRRDGGDPGLRANHHPTVKPIDLMRWLVRLAVPRGSFILDPFAGSGTTLIAAHLEGMDYAGIDLDPEYCEIARARLKHWKPAAQQGIFTEAVLV